MADYSLADKLSTQAQLLETLGDVLRLLDARRQHIAAAHIDTAIQHLCAAPDKQAFMMGASQPAPAPLPQENLPHAGLRLIKTER